MEPQDNKEKDKPSGEGQHEMQNNNSTGMKVSSSQLSVKQKTTTSQVTLRGQLSDYLEKNESDLYLEYPGVERSDYDFTAERKYIHLTNLVDSTAHLIKGCVGTGVLGIHEGYMYGGLWTSLGVNIIIGILVSHCMMMVVKSAQKMYTRLRVPMLSYPDLVEVAVTTGPMKNLRRFSKVFRYISELVLFVEFNGTCCVFQIMMAATLKKAIEAVSVPAENLALSIRLYILMITLPLLALCLTRSLKHLAPFSILADLILTICVISTMIYSISIAKNIGDRPAWKSFHGLFRFCGFCIYSVDGVAISLPIENHMYRPRYFNIVRQCAMSFVVPYVMIVGFFGYLAWGEDCRSPITNQLSKSVASIIMQFLLTIFLGVTFSVHFWVPFKIIWYYLGHKYKKKRGVWERFYRLSHVLLITLLAIACPNMSKWMEFIGCFFTPIIVFMFPALIETFVTWKEPRNNLFRWNLLKNTILLFFGMMMCVGTLIIYL